MGADLVPRAAIDELHAALAELPQAPGFLTDHLFAGGMYCRKMFIPAGTTIVSKVHKTEHFFVGCCGELRVVGQSASYTLRAGDVVVSPIGTKRAVLAITDVVCLTVHRTDRTTLDGLEDEMVEVDGQSLYDVNNQPKQGVIVCDQEGVPCLG